MRQVSITITPIQAESIVRNLTKEGVTIVLKRTTNKAEKQGGGFLPLLMAALPAVAAAVGTGALSGAAGYGTTKLLNALSGSGLGEGPTITLSRSQWERMTSAGGEPLVVNFKVSKSKNMATGQSGGSLAGKMMPMIVRALSQAAARVGAAAGKQAVKAGTRLVSRGISAGERKVGNYLDSGYAVPVVQPVPHTTQAVVNSSLFGEGIFSDLQGAVTNIPLVGKALRRGLAPVVATEFIAQEGMRVGRDAARVFRDGRRVYDDGRRTVRRAKHILSGEGFKLAGQGHQKKNTTRRRVQY